MSIVVLPRQLGVKIKCDHGHSHVDNETCGEFLQTGCILVKPNRAFAFTKGWKRGGKGRRWMDFCPVHALVEDERLRVIAEKRESRRAAREAKRLERALKVGALTTPEGGYRQ